MTEGNGIEVQRHGCAVQLTPRLRRIIRYLVQHQEILETTPKLSITFDCAGNSVQVKRTEHLETLPD